ncbi:hypothetical protein Vadar_008445 [Vaccinium darrowii]|uniref:Uncharacterized protein n=1 Tax=Vaccinium darrowii TaxID=229202 RepID=A0ACB7YVU1_9ERIC|nr:hypothetical protein Vadar_008445 [Vaccinium darrowii]
MVASRRWVTTIHAIQRYIGMAAMGQSHRVGGLRRHLGGTVSSCSNNSVATSVVTSDGQREKSLEYADELMERGTKAAK